MNRRKFAALIGGLLAAPLTALPQPAGRMLRIGILDDASENARRHLWGAFLKRLGQLGYVEGQNLAVEARYAQRAAERLPVLAADLVAMKPDIMIVVSTPATRAAMQATSSIAIVFIGLGDPVGAGVVANLSRPGGNATGFSIMSTELGAKWFELLREIAPGAKKFAYLSDLGNKGSLLAFGQLQEQARTLNLAVRMLDGRQRVELERSFNTIVRERFEGLIVGATAVLLDHREQILQFAARQKLPAIYARREYADAGGLLFYGAELGVMYQRAAEYVHRIAQGAKPSELPVERSSTVRMVLNLKTARALGIKIPQRLLVRADEVID